MGLAPAFPRQPFNSRRPKEAESNLQIPAPRPLPRRPHPSLTQGP